MVLCEIPRELWNERNAYDGKMTDNLRRSVQQDIHKVEQPGQPIAQSCKTSVTRGGFKE